MSAYPHLLAHTTDAGVRTLRLHRPEKLNAVNPALAESLPQALADAGADDAVRAVVITGAGRGFCAGLDLGDPAGLRPRTRAERLDPLLWVGRWVLAAARCEKPVIAAVRGPAAGAGFGLALACDLRLVAEGSRMTAGYVRRGLSPDAGVSYWLPRIVGHGRAAEILLTGRDVDAAEAERIGLANAVLPVEGFDEAVADYAARLAAGPPVAHALTKRVLLGAWEASLEQHLHAELQHIRTTLSTEDVAEAMAAFREKRAPTFRGV